MKVTIRKFRREDIPLKVKWINDPNNNQYLHYDLPLEVGKTEKWFEKVENSDKRVDAVIELDNKPVGLIGLLCIDKKNKKAEYYITMGENTCKGKGVSKRASKLILKYGFEELGLNKIYLYTETDNIKAQILFESLGFKKEGLLKNDLYSKDSYVDRFLYGLLKEEWANNIKIKKTNERLVNRNTIEFYPPVSAKNIAANFMDNASLSIGK